MNKFFVMGLFFLMLACVETRKQPPTAQQIVDSAIKASGGQVYKTQKVAFTFRNRNYVSEVIDGKKVVQRISFSDSMTITDVLENQDFRRFFNDSLIDLPDTLANRYANSVNSVHYFARLPFGLNDPAVNKTFLGTSAINGENFYKVKVTFDQDNGGEDFEDTYLYWFDQTTFTPKYLAYEFHVDGGGMRFREAYNERYVGGIRFVDYNNYKPRDKAVDFFKIDSLFMAEQLELLSKIELREIQVTKAN
ncbi:MAG: DUF6503 family protein [Bacteroidota bacterium]